MSTSPSSSLSDPLSSLSSQADGSYPYSPGTTLTLKRHIPPPPRGQDHHNLIASRRDVPGKVPKLEWCRAHPPTPGTTDPLNVHKITFKTPIRTGDQCGAQVLLTDDGCVAKLYDPRFYCIFNREWTNETINVTAEADEDYSNETAAYSALEGTPLQGSIMPTYYGSWTAKVSIEVEGQEDIRDVRMILIEHIEGVSMEDINLFDLTCTARENVMRKVIEADMDLCIAGLKHKDFAPRNIMLVVPPEYAACGTLTSHSSVYEDAELRVCIIDFAISCENELADPNRSGARFHNPLFFWAGADLYCEYGWLPPRAEATNWMWETWGDGGAEGKYIRVERDWEDYYGRPVHVWE